MSGQLVCKRVMGSHLQTEKVERRGQIGETGDLDTLVLVECRHSGQAQLIAHEAQKRVDFIGVRRADIHEQPIVVTMMGQRRGKGYLVSEDYHHLLHLHCDHHLFVGGWSMLRYLLKGL